MESQAARSTGQPFIGKLYKSAPAGEDKIIEHLPNSL